MTVIDLAQAKTERAPHMSGEAFCTHCHHVWQAVSPVGTTTFECPECGTSKGVYRNGVRPEEGASLFMCNCGNDLFVVQPHRIMCCNCGTSTRWEDLT